MRGYRVNIIDVAREAGVSKTTVSRVLTNSKLVKPETREKVLATIEKMGFVPNTSAQKLAGNRNYVIGIIMGILLSLVLKHTGFKGNPVPFVLELPNYRMPSTRTVLQLIWEKTKDFVTRAFTIIFLATIIIWFFQSFDTRLNPVADSSESMLAAIGSFIAPLFRPLGFGDWRISTALITGFSAKESVVSTLTVLLGGDTAALSSLFTPLVAFAFLIFTLLYTPCVAAIATVRRELGRRWAWGVVVLQCSIAWIAAFAVRMIGMLFGAF